MRLFDPLFAARWLTLHFSRPKMPAIQPVVASPAEDEAAKLAREQESQAASVDAASRGRRSTIFAGKSLTDEEFITTLGGKRGGSRRGAAADLGSF